MLTTQKFSGSAIVPPSEASGGPTKEELLAGQSLDEQAALVEEQLRREIPRDPLAFGLAVAVMAIVAMVACFFPAWRASRIDPVLALRQ